MKLTISEVARKAKVSSTTVSLSFRKGSRISEETRQRVLKAAHEIGYVPNQFARRLRLGRSQLIGLIVTEADTPFMSEIIAGVEKTVAARGYNVLIFATGRNAKVEQNVVASAYEMKVEGIIICACEEENDALVRLNNQGFPIVFVDSVPTNMQCLCVINDVEAVGRLGTEYLINLGHRRILLLNGPYAHRHFSSFTRLEKAYKSSLREHDIPVDKRLVRYSGLYIKDGCASIEKALDEGVDFTAVQAISDNTALGVIECLEKHGRRVPDDVSVLGIDNTETAALGRIGLSTIETYNHSRLKGDMGTIAAKLLIEVLEENNGARSTSPVTVLKPRLVLRDSCRPL